MEGRERDGIRFAHFVREREYSIAAVTSDWKDIFLCGH